MDINAQTQLNLVVGNPIQHSKSPSLHQHIYEALGINAVLLAIENPDLTDLIQSIRTLSIGLTAVTLPFKTSILSHVDTQSDAVQRLHAANTLMLRNGLIHAENTDVDGILYALSATPLRDKHILIMGAGGSARAVGYALHDKQATLHWMNRTPAHAAQLAEQWGGNVVTEKQIRDLPIDIIINATSVGMSPHANQTPLVNYDFHPHQIVFDLVYTPRETQLLCDARKAGATCISGVVMFAAQACQQVALFCNQPISTSLLSTLITQEASS